LGPLGGHWYRFCLFPGDIGNIGTGSVCPQKQNIIINEKNYERMKLMLNNKKMSKGITLIALVVTIIVLLILARNFYINVIW